MDGEPPLEEDFSQIPLIERSLHKVCCNVLYKRLLTPELESQIISLQRCRFESSKDGVGYGSLFQAIPVRRLITVGLAMVDGIDNRRKWCLDANVVAQEKGIEAVLALVQYSGESAAK